MRGYFRLSNRSIDVRRCPDAAVNCDASPVCTQSHSGCRGTVGTKRAFNKTMDGLASSRRQLETTTGDFGCESTLTGVFCQQCLPRPDGQMAYYSRATEEQKAHCALCESSMVIVPACVAAGLVLAIVCLYYASRRKLLRVPKASLARLSTAWHALAPHVKLKIVVGFYVLATRVNTVYEIEMPYQVKRMLNVFSVIVSLGIGDVSTPLECIGWHSYRSRLLFYIAFPFVLAALFLLFAAWHLCYVMGKRFSPVALMQLATPSLLKLAFIVYPLCTNTAFEAFSCHQLIREGEQREEYLKVRPPPHLHHSSTRTSTTPPRAPPRHLHTSE